jgi:molecular chaperone DnaJ
MDKKDYYEVLGVSRNAGLEEIKSAYRKKAMQYHPDRNQGDKESEEMFKLAAEAYEVLSDSDKRARYDRFGFDGVRGAGGQQGFNDVSDIFSHFGDIFGGSIFGDFFGGGSSRQGSRGRRRPIGEPGSDIKIRIALTLGEIAEGVTKKVKVRAYQTCSTCQGTGSHEGAGYTTCTHCNGQGEIRQVTKTFLGQIVNVAACPTCNGSGQMIKDKCHECRGEGRVDGEHTVEVNIPAGVEEGQYLSVENKGHAGKRGGPAGELYVIFEEKPHPFFKRVGNDIHYNLKIPFTLAALGGEIEVPTISGTGKKIEIESGTQPGSHITLKNMGIPYLERSTKGSEIINIDIAVPKKLNSREKELLKELFVSENFVISKSDKKGKDFFDKVKDIFTD